MRVRWRAATFKSKWCAYARGRQHLCQSGARTHASGNIYVKVVRLRMRAAPFKPKLPRGLISQGGHPHEAARQPQYATVRHRKPKGSSKEAQRSPPEVQRKRIRPGSHRRPKVKSATHNNDFKRVFADPGLGGNVLSIRLCRETALAQISRAVTKTFEIDTFQCLAWKTKPCNS